MEEQTNELKLELLGTGSGLSTFTGHNSASRQQMFCSHLTQALVVEGSTPKRIQTGAERDYGNYTFKIEMPVDAQIIKIIQKYPITPGFDSIKENPLIAVIYEDVETKEVGILEIEKYFTKHTTFGMKYVFNDKAMSRLSKGALIPKGTIFAHSPNVKGDNYCFGIDTNFCFLSIPQVIEDGMVVSESFIEKLAVQEIGQREIEFGKDKYPLNLYGDENNYKPFPDIGDTIRPDGLIAVLRKYDEINAFNEMGPNDLTADGIDFDHDELIYAVGGATIYDVESNRDFTLRIPTCPLGMEKQSAKYERAQSIFYEELQDTYRQLKRRRGENLRLSKRLHQLMVEAIAGSDPLNKKKNANYTKVRRTYRRNPIDNWRVVLKYNNRTVPTLGYKITDMAGGKGVNKK